MPWFLLPVLLVVSGEVSVDKSACCFHLSGFLFWVDVFFRHAHYQAGITPLALVWKDENCSQYVLDTDSKGQVPNQQQVFSLVAFTSYHSLLCFHAYISIVWLCGFLAPGIEKCMYVSLVPLVRHFMDQFFLLLVHCNYLLSKKIAQLRFWSKSGYLLMVALIQF